MPINRRDEKQDNLNVRDDFEKDKDIFPLTPDMLGWLSAPEDQRNLQYNFFNADYLELESPALGFERMLPYPTTVDGMSVVTAYEQTGGTCVGFSGMQACTGRHMLRDNSPKRFDAYGYYCKVRAAMGDPSCNRNAGATLPAAGKVLQNWGAAQIIGGRIQANDVNNGITSYVWGYNADSIRTAIANGIVPVVGISVYQAMLSPKKIGNNWWQYWQDGSWGGMLGGHAMAILGWSDTIKLTTSSKGSMWLPNSWGYDWCEGKGAWMSYEAFTRLLNAAQPAEIRLDTDRVTGPSGKLELQKATITPSAPVVGDKVQFTFEVKNVGDGKLIGIQLGIEEKVDEIFPDGYRGDLVDLNPGEVAKLNPVSVPVVAGHWRYRFDNLKPYTILSVIEVDVTDTPPPPPPPPPPTDTKTFNFNKVEVDGVGYTSINRYPDGVILDEIK